MRVLLVDDEAAARYGARRLLESAGHEVVEADSGEACLVCLDLSKADAILLDYQLGSGLDGLGVLAALKERPFAPPVVLFTAQGSERIAVEAIKNGAWDYLVKPAGPEELVLTLERAGKHFRATRENRRLRDEMAQLRPKGLVGNSSSMKLLREQISLVGPSPANVLILGESGTGKEVVARALHEASGREGPFVAVNCAALPASLVESELFGHEKGAFTGAVTEREGRIRQADGGTIFLDEIGDMPMEAQVRLLRVLEERVVEPLGGSRSIPVDIRVLAATHRDLRQMVSEGRFREDLFFRLDVLSLRLSPLRERGRDILVIAASLLGKLASGQKLSLSPKAESALLRYGWPGNVRELRNVMERASILCRGGEIGPEHLMLPLPPSAVPEPAMSRDPVADPGPDGTLCLPGIPLALSFREAKTQFLDIFERAFVRAKFEECEGNVSRTALVLDMHRQSLQQKLKDMGISRNLLEQEE